MRRDGLDIVNATAGNPAVILASLLPAAPVSSQVRRDKVLVPTIQCTHACPVCQHCFLCRSREGTEESVCDLQPFPIP